MTSQQNDHDKGNRFLSISMGLCCLILCFVLLFYKNKFPSDIAVYVRIIFAMGIAGISAALIGYIKIKNIHGVTAVGGFAVFLLIYSTNPVGFGSDNFGLTLMLKNNGSEMSINLSGTVSITVGNDKKTKKIGEDGTVDFKQIPTSFKNKRVNMELQMPGWQFVNGRNDAQLTLNQDSAIINIQRDSSLCCITGTVKDERGNYLKDVAVMVDGIVDSSNLYGYFELKIPASKQREEQQVIVIKKGFKSFNGAVYPSTKTPLNIALQRK